MISGGTNESAGDKAHPRSWSQNNVIGHTLQYGLSMDHQVSIVDGDLRSNRHLCTHYYLPRVNCIKKRCYKSGTNGKKKIHPFALDTGSMKV